MIERKVVARSCVIMSEDCPFCKAPKREKIEEGIRDSTFSKSVVARELNMTPAEVYNHMMEHLDKETSLQTVRSLEITLSKRDLLMNVLLDLNDRFSMLLSKEGLDQKTTSQIVSIAEGIRKNVMDLAKLEGELSQEEHVTIIHYNEFKSFIIEAVQKFKCPGCGKILGGTLMDEIKHFQEEELRR